MQKTKSIRTKIVLASYLIAISSFSISGFLTPRSAEAAYPGQNGKIAFYSDRDGAPGGYGEIYVMNADGSGQVNVTNDSGYDEDPVWSPDGTKIAFYSSRDGAPGGYGEIYVMNADGSGQTRLTTNVAEEYSPVWSPDGTKIAFYSSRDGNYEIYSMNADGSGQTRLTTNAAADTNPGWSPNGNKLLFSSDRNGNIEIYTMNTDGTNQTRLTNNSAFDNFANWSPDSTKIVFHSGRDGNTETYSMNADGTNQTRLTTNAAADEFPAWSPDGTKITFDSNRDAGNYEIYSMNADGSGQTRLTTNAALEYNSDWQPLTIVPVATNDPSVTTGVGTPVVIDVLANDTDTYGSPDPASVTITVAAGHGTTSINATTGAITYNPTIGFSGTDTFTYQVCSSESAVLCDTATVTITVGTGATAVVPGLPSTGSPTAGSFSWIYALACTALAVSLVILGKRSGLYSKIYAKARK